MIGWPWLRPRGNHVAESPELVFDSSQSPGPIPPIWGSPLTRGAIWVLGCLPIASAQAPAHSLGARFLRRTVSPLITLASAYACPPTLVHPTPSHSGCCPNRHIVLKSPPTARLFFCAINQKQCIESNFVQKGHPDCCPTSRFTFRAARNTVWLAPLVEALCPKRVTPCIETLPAEI